MWFIKLLIFRTGNYSVYLIIDLFEFENLFEIKKVSKIVTNN